MQGKSKILLFVFTGIILVILSFYAGWKISQNKTNATYIQHYEMVRHIAELGVLEVSGLSKVDLGNEQTDDDNSILDILKATLFERQIKLEIPFVAKFGVKMTETKPIINSNPTEIEVILPPVVLLSYELHLDKMDAMSRKGLFVFENSDDYIDAERMLYKQNRALLENNVKYIKQSEDRISTLLNEYFSPSEKKVHVSFTSSTTSTSK